MERIFFQKFGKLLYRLDNFYNEFAKKSGVKPNLMWILYALDDGMPHSQKEISTSWDIPITTINTIVKELINDGYVELSHIKGKRREMNIILTKKGVLYSKEILSDLYKIEDSVYKTLNERIRVNDDLEFIANKFSEIGE